MRKIQLILMLAFAALSAQAAYPGYWQQEVDYTINIDVNVENYQYTGAMKLVYTNNSPDDLNRVFFHLYFNAFQPGSMMDVRSQTIADPDPRVGDRISRLTPEEQGWMRIQTLTMNGKPVSFKEVGTILEVDLPSSVRSGKKATFEMTWDAQVPLQVRRSGRTSAEGIEFSMAQWYPKMCEYDIEGWHANPYVGREFHGVWGDFKVNITIDKNYLLGATGTLKNANEIGHGYESGKVQQKPVNGKLTWRWEARRVHDFVWAADPDYVHFTEQVPDGPLLRFIYQPNPDFDTNWEELPRFMTKAFTYLSKNFGNYPYPVYSFIQGGDGGMEYPMATLITGHRSLRSLVGVSVHEAAHSWYQGVLATNEALYEWMDEGFTSFATDLTMLHLFADPTRRPHQYAYQGYIGLALSGKENPLTTHADHYTTNYAYGMAAYSKGEVLLAQLGYVIGADVRDRGLLRYFEEWKFKHPTPRDFKRVMERESGIELDWYFEYFEKGTHSIDYAIKSVADHNDETFITLERIGLMPMPVDLQITLTSGEKLLYTIPLRIMRGAKQKPADFDGEFKVAPAWPWTNSDYELQVPFSSTEIVSIEIDPARGMADVDRSNNSLVIDAGTRFLFERTR